VSKGEFSVYVWAADGTYWCEQKFVDAETAVKTAKSQSSNVAARAGLTKKIMITDGGDSCVFEWQYGKGVVHG